jgi:hypothetical protein
MTDKFAALASDGPGIQNNLQAALLWLLAEGNVNNIYLKELLIVRFLSEFSNIWPLSIEAADAVQNSKVDCLGTLAQPGRNVLAGNAENGGRGGSLNVIAVPECVAHGFVFGNMRQQSQLDLGIVGVKQSVFRTLRDEIFPDLQAEIAGILVQLGFKNNLSGFRYVVSGLPMFAENPQQTVTKELYPAIGKLHGKTGEQVERAIRNAIELAWQRRDERIWRMYFAPAPDGSVPRPTNGQLLHTLMRQISGLQKDEKIG